MAKHGRRCSGVSNEILWRQDDPEWGTYMWCFLDIWGKWPSSIDLNLNLPFKNNLLDSCPDKADFTDSECLSRLSRISHAQDSPSSEACRAHCWVSAPTYFAQGDWGSETLQVSFCHFDTFLQNLFQKTHVEAEVVLTCIHSLDPPLSTQATPATR